VGLSSTGAGAGSAGFSVVVLGLRLRPPRRAPGRLRLAFCCLGTCSCVSCTAASSGAAVVDACA